MWKSWFDEDHVRQFNSLKDPCQKEHKAGRVNWPLLPNRPHFPWLCQRSPFSYKDIRYTKISILDVSHVKMTEFELMKAKEKAEVAAKAKSRFLSNMSHELRTPLNGIIGASNLLVQEEHLPSQEAHLDILKFSSEHMMMLINDILDYNKIEAGKLELAEAPSTSKNSYNRCPPSLLRRSKQRASNSRPISTIRLNAEFITDETRLNQVLSNLLSNAIKFTHAGKITLAVQEALRLQRQSYHPVHRDGYRYWNTQK